MTFLANVRLKHGWAKAIAALDNQSYSMFRNKVENKELREALPDTRAAFDEAKAEKTFNYWQEFFSTGEEVELLTSIGIELELKRIKGVASNSNDPRTTIYQISVANVGLMQIQCVEVLEDCCTNELQGWLDRSWRILAVCPPNDARRPSYVMGHFDKEPHR